LYNNPPFSYLDDTGNIDGFDVALVKTLVKGWGIDAEFVAVTRQTRLSALFDGEVDFLAAGLSHSRDLEQYVEFTDTTFQGGYSVLVRSGEGIETPGQIGNNLVLAIGQDATDLLHTYGGAHGMSPQISTVLSADEALQTFMVRPDVKAVVARREQLMAIASQYPGTQILSDFILVMPYALAVRRGDVRLRDMLNLSLRQAVREGEYANLFSTYMYSFAADSLLIWSGDPAYTFDTMPVEIPASALTVNRLKSRSPLRVVGFTLDAQPKAFDSQPIYDGFNRAVVNEVARRWDITVQEIPQSTGDTGRAMLESGQADIMVGVTPDLSTVGSLYVTVPYYDSGMRMIYLQGASVGGIGDLEFKPVVAIDPVERASALISANNSSPTIKTVSSPEEAFQYLVNSLAYAIVGDEYSVMLMARSDARVILVDSRFRPTSHTIAASISDPDLIKLLNMTLQDMNSDGTLDRIRNEYFDPYLPPDKDLGAFHMETWPGVSTFLGVGGY
jgi:ABC-type amino acid transport substrate-binding protein